jgi:plasmid stability protein
MPTLYVENVPEDLYAALRKRAADRRTSMAAEVIELLRQNVPTDKELARRRSVLNRMLRIQSAPSPRRGAFRAAEEMIREDRDR